jgi:hypothetical protein
VGVPLLEQRRCIQYEINIFAESHPEYGQFLFDGDNYSGLYRIILDKIDGWNLLISESSLLDGFRWAESEGLLGKVTDAEKGIQHGKVVTMKVTKDPRPGYWTRESVRKAVAGMSSSEFQEILNADKDFRALVDSGI